MVNGATQRISLILEWLPSDVLRKRSIVYGGMRFLYTRVLILLIPGLRAHHYFNPHKYTYIYPYKQNPPC